MSVLASLKDLTPFDLAAATRSIRSTFADLKYQEVVLNPLDSYPIEYQGETVDAKPVGQLRFNTEPEIWEAAAKHERFFSISYLFRREKQLNLLRRSSFLIVDFYRKGQPTDLLRQFFDLLQRICIEIGLTRLANLDVCFADFDPKMDGPTLKVEKACWVVTSGYEPANSFFEVDGRGKSTRQELFLVLPNGYLEIGALGIVGRNLNPSYVLRGVQKRWPIPPLGFSGMGFGLERLLLAEKLVR